MKILISTPCFGGQLTERYVSSLITCLSTAIVEGLLEGWQFHFQSKESLIHRARNRAAAFFLRGDFDKLITIDADIQWSYEDFKRLALSEKEIVGGLYPLKTFPPVANFNPLPDRGGEFFKTNRGIDYDAWQEFKGKYADPEGLIEVRHLATGFLAVKREVFETLQPKVETYQSFDAVSGVVESFHHFYSSGVHEGILESEDWSFCRRAREAGFRVYLDSEITLGHEGSHTYRLGQFYGEVQRAK